MENVWHWLIVWAIFQQWLMMYGGRKWVQRIMIKLKPESIENITEGVFSFDEAFNAKFLTDDNGKILNINKAAEALFGYKKYEVIDENIDIIIPEEHKKSFHGMIKRMKTKTKEEMEDKPSFTELVKKNGETFPVEFILRRREHHEHLHYITIVRDRSEDVKQIKMLKQIISLKDMENDVLSGGEEVGDTGSWIWNLATREITPSANHRKIIGLPPGKHTIDDIKPRIFDDDKEMVQSAIDGAVKDGKSYDIKYRIIRGSDLLVLHIESRAKPVLNEDGIPIAIRGSMKLLSTSTLLEEAKKQEHE